MSDAILKMHADICKVFTNPIRLRILSLLKNGELSVGELCEELELSQPSMSQHLGFLRDRKIVRSRKDGTNVFYSIGNKKILDAMDIMHQVIIEQLRKDTEFLKEIDNR